MRKLILILLALIVVGPKAYAEEKIQWSNWTEQTFETAKKENKFVILDLEAVWCHWCHVMD